MYIRKFSEAALNRALKLKNNELPYYLEKMMKQYINEQLVKHTTDINRMIIDNERQLMKNIDKKQTEEFWKFAKISINGFGALFSLGLVGCSSLFVLGYAVKEELKEDINKINNRIENIESRIARIENKVEQIDTKMDIIIDAIYKTSSKQVYNPFSHSSKK